MPTPRPRPGPALWELHTDTSRPFLCLQAICEAPVIPRPNLRSCGLHGRAAVPNLLAPGTNFMEDSFSKGRGWGDGFSLPPDESRTLHLLCTLFLLSFHQLHFSHQALDPRGWGPHMKAYKCFRSFPLPTGGSSSDKLRPNGKGLPVDQSSWGQNKPENSLSR